MVKKVIYFCNFGALRRALECCDWSQLWSGIESAVVAGKRCRATIGRSGHCSLRAIVSPVTTFPVSYGEGHSGDDSPHSQDLWNGGCFDHAFSFPAATEIAGGEDDAHTGDPAGNDVPPQHETGT